MNLLSAENISKSYSEKQLLNNISLGISEGDKIGLIGVNGTGKSTFLKILAGLENADHGRVIAGNTIKIEYISQNPNFSMEVTVLEQVFKGDSPVMRLIREYEAELENPKSSERVLQLTQSMDHMNAWSIESEAKTVLTKLGINDFNATIGSLSGGLRKRIALAAALINPSDLLILDEPTNHLDNDTIDWLEQYLTKRNGAVLMVTHDRYFLDRIVNEIIELDNGNLYLYKGNYSYFLEKKAEREENEASNDKKRQSLFKKELAWIRRGAQARSTKQKARIERFETLSEKLVNDSNEKLEISVGSSRLGKKVVELELIKKAFGDKLVLDNFTYIVLRDDRIGIIGPNGIGKSTLMNIIAGQVKQDSGIVDMGSTVKIGYYTQETQHMNESMRAIEYIKEVAEYIENAEGFKISASQMMEKFLFTGSMQYTRIAKLSGGERRRLYLLRVLMEAPNVLLLDEPTNDLDIETLTILEDYLEEFPGAVIAVSHDRYFLDRMAEKIFFFEGNGIVKHYTGNYSEFKEKYDSDEKINIKSAVKNKEYNKNIENLDKKKDKPLKFTFKEQKEFAEIDQVISELEGKIAEIEDKINLSSSNYLILQNLLVELKDLQNQLEEKMNRWYYLNELAEKIENEKK
ncbi:MAG: transporter related protein [Haloplasmataceae bacterium]|jgi:ATP-binding cassette subfamily F protein uup|nr:transporter related protein [Haloplasmataceae bacterium]